MSTSQDISIDYRYKSRTSVVHCSQIWTRRRGVLNRCEEYILQQFNFQGNPPDGMYPQFFFHLQLAERYGMEDVVQVGVSSERVKKAYYSMSNQGILRLVHHSKGYKDEESFKQLSYRTKFLILSTRLTIAEAAIDLEDLYLESKKHFI
ncbi:hypothetical protein CHS0354_016716 [Potamilus streckersoni]|uniref:Uncharacterized protein n=1 Tax=Potamilus streckersoni TaxID=2493646 RepID=A0AAE0WA36_9BIVA|nr:hypothetical protein CHS0354_016716 [Potamilus streckersoni]